MFALAEPPGLRTLSSPHSRDMGVLWRAGSFVCELRSDPTCPAFLSILKNGEPVLEVPVLSALDAEERAISLRIIVERHQPTSRSAM
jgi:hypothetical protein